MKAGLLILPLLLPGAATGQRGFPALPSGIMLPVTLDHGIDARHVRPGDRITAHTTEPVPLGEKSSIPAHARVIGRITAVRAPSAGSPGAMLALRFDEVRFSRLQIPIDARIRAIVSYVAVADAKVPEASPGFGDSEANWTTRQIGGDIAYHQGPIVNHGHDLGTETLYGALIDPEAIRSSLPVRLAFGEFSAHAVGVYGFRDLEVIAPNIDDSLQLLSAHSNIKLNGGTELLLVVAK